MLTKIYFVLAVDTIFAQARLINLRRRELSTDNKRTCRQHIVVFNLFQHKNLWHSSPRHNEEAQTHRNQQADNNRPIERCYKGVRTAC